MIKMGVDVLVKERLHDPHVDDVAGFRADFAIDTKLGFVVMAVIVGIVAWSEGVPVPLGTAIRVIQAVGGVEVHAANDGGGRHA